MTPPKKIRSVAITPKQELAPVQFSAEALIAQGIDKGMPVETMERLLNMRRELKAEWAKSRYDIAMASFQADCKTIKKTKEVKTDDGRVAYSYAPLDEIVKQVGPLLKKHGFSYSTSMDLLDKGVKVELTVKHVDGHSEISPMQVPFGSKTRVMSDTQVAAAATTFAKRYAFCNAFGILTGDEDNDAVIPPDNKKKQFVTPPVTNNNNANFDKAMKMVNACKNTDVLIDYAEKLKGSKNFSAPQLKTLNGLISTRVDELLASSGK